MADTGAHPTRRPALEELAAVLKLPLAVVTEITDGERAEHLRRMDDGDAQVAEILARRAA